MNSFRHLHCSSTIWCRNVFVEMFPTALPFTADYFMPSVSEKNQTHPRMDVTSFFLSLFIIHLQYKQYVSRQPVVYTLNEPVTDGEHPSITSMWAISRWGSCSHACAGGMLDILYHVVIEGH